MKDDRILLDETVADQVSIWKRSKGFSDKVVVDHACSGETCSYHRIGDVFVCEKTGHVHSKNVSICYQFASLSKRKCTILDLHVVKLHI